MKRRRDDGTFGSTQTYLTGGRILHLSHRYANSVEPRMSEEVPKRVKMISEMQDYEGWEQGPGYMKDEYNLEHGGSNRTGDYEIFVNPETEDVYFSFGHFSPDTTMRGFVDFATNNPQSDNALVLRNIPSNNVARIKEHPLFSDDVRRQIAADIARYEGHTVKMVGYSKGGYLAKYWGSVFGVDQEIINAHVMPGNTFPESSAKTTFHTIATDETSFKYNIPGTPRPNEEHVVYPSLEEVDDFNLFTGNIWGNHINDNFEVEAFDTPEIERMYDMPRGSTIEPALSKAGGAIMTADIGLDIANGDYRTAEAKGVIGGTFLANPALGTGIAGTMQIVSGSSEIKAGEVGTGARHVTEGSLMDLAAIGIPLATAAGAITVETGGGLITGVGDAVAAVETAVRANEDRRNKHYGDMVAHGMESALFTAGTLGSALPVVGGVVGLGFAAAAGVVDLVDRGVHIFARHRHRSDPKPAPPPQVRRRSVPDIDDTGDKEPPTRRRSVPAPEHANSEFKKAKTYAPRVAKGV